MFATLVICIAVMPAAMAGHAAMDGDDVCVVPDPAAYTAAAKQLQQPELMENMQKFFQEHPDQKDAFRQMLGDDELMRTYFDMVSAAKRLFEEYGIADVEALRFCTDPQYRESKMSAVGGEVWAQLEEPVTAWHQRVTQPGFTDALLAKIKGAWSQAKTTMRRSRRSIFGKKAKVGEAAPADRGLVRVQSRSCERSEARAILWALIRIPKWIALFTAGQALLLVAAFFWPMFYLLNLVGILLASLPGIGRPLSFIGFLANAGRQLSVSLYFLGNSLSMVMFSVMMDGREEYVLNGEARDFARDALSVVRHGDVGRANPFQGVLYPRW